MVYSEDKFKKDEKDVILDQLETIGRVTGNLENPTRETEKFETYLDRLLLSLYWLEALISPFLDFEYKRELKEIEAILSKDKSIRGRMKFIREFEHLLIQHLHDENLYFARYKGFVLKYDKKKEAFKKKIARKKEEGTLQIEDFMGVSDDLLE